MLGGLQEEGVHATVIYIKILFLCSAGLPQMCTVQRVDFLKNFTAEHVPGFPFE